MALAGIWRYEHAVPLLLSSLALPVSAYASDLNSATSAGQGSIVSLDRSSGSNTIRSTLTPAFSASVSSQRAIQGLQQATQPNVMPPRLVNEPEDGAAAVTAQASGASATSGSASTTATTATAPSAPDERPLWRLLRAGELVDLDAAIAALQRTFPGWSPSAGLLAERARQVLERAIDAALNGDVPLLKKLITQSPDEFGCEHIDRAWRAADLLAASGDTDAVYDLYRRIIPSCSSDVNRIATLQNSLHQLPSNEVDALIALEAGSGVRGAEADRNFTILRDARALDVIEKSDVDAAVVQTGLTQLVIPIRASHDVGGATRAGWIAFARHDLKNAAEWFELAMTMPTITTGKGAGAADSAGPAASPDAALGLAQVRVAQGDADAADHILAGLHLDSDARVRALRVQIALLRANDAYARKQYKNSLQFVDQALALGASSEQVDIMQGWSFYGLGEFQRAASAFDAHYRKNHDDDSAEGLALSTRAMAHQGGTKDANALLSKAAAEHAGPLNAYVAALQAQQLYYQKQFLAANAEWQVAKSAGANPARIAHYMPGDLTGIDAPSITGGLAWSDHAGAKGTSRLTTLSPTVEAEWYDKTRSYDLRYKQNVLSNGAGTVNAEELQLKVGDTLHVTDGRLLEVYASAGVTQGGATSVAPQGELAIGQHATSNSWSAYIASSPVRDSLLSWRGMTGSTAAGGAASWGGVKRQAVGGNASWQIAPRWTVSAGGDIEWLAGQNVLGNEGAKADASLTYDLQLPGFDYVSVGPAMHYLGYRRNENFYVFQQGGYYSPQLSTSAGLTLQFLSLEGQMWQWTGNVEMGWNYTRQADGDCGSAGQICSGGIDRGLYTHMQLAAVRRLSARWQVGSLMDVNVTPGRDKQIAALGFLRYFLSDRAAVYSRDLPGGTQDFHAAFDAGG